MESIFLIKVVRDRLSLLLLVDTSVKDEPNIFTDVLFVNCDRAVAGISIGNIGSTTVLCYLIISNIFCNDAMGLQW